VFEFLAEIHIAPADTKDSTAPIPFQPNQPLKLCSSAQAVSIWKKEIIAAKASTDEILNHVDDFDINNCFSISIMIKYFYINRNFS